MKEAEETTSDQETDNQHKSQRKYARIANKSRDKTRNKRDKVRALSGYQPSPVHYTPSG